jgi:hypothetical protein
MRIKKGFIKCCFVGCKTTMKIEGRFYGETYSLCDEHKKEYLKSRILGVSSWIIVENLRRKRNRFTISN